MPHRPPIAANPDAYIPLTPPGADRSVVVPVVRCPSTTHASGPPVAVATGTYLPGTPSATRAVFCATCATELTLAGLFDPRPKET